MKVIITGMHRSGTSMVAGLLGKCGLYLGNNLLHGGRWNPKGHFEDVDFLHLNIDILKDSGGSWHKPPVKIEPTDKTWKKMASFLFRWPDKKLGWKDPRACLTLEAWKRIINPAELKIIFVSRKWTEIVKSLEARNGLGYKKSMALCKIYHQRFLKNSMDFKSVNYESFFIDWKQELKKATDYLGLKIPENENIITDFIDKGLYHHRAK